jgi:hypothetical protein
MLKKVTELEQTCINLSKYFLFTQKKVHMILQEHFHYKNI